MANLFRCCAILIISLSCLFPIQSFSSQTLKIGMVLDLGGKDDKSFNSSAVRGIQLAKDKYRVTAKVIEPNDVNAFVPLLRSLAQKDYDLIIAIGVSQVQAVKQVASAFQNKKFVILDGEVQAPNVQSILFEEQEGSYLVGAIAAMMSKTGKIGFIGGMDIPIVRRFETGYLAGAKQINPKVQLISNFIGITHEAWSNPAKAKELATSQYDSNADIIFSASGASITGVFDAAEEKKKFAIGVDSNQNWIKPGYVLTSMVKNIDRAILEAIKELNSGKFLATTRRLGLSEQGVEYSLDQYNEKLLPRAVIKKADSLKQDIISKKIVVPDFYQKKK